MGTSPRIKRSQDLTDIDQEANDNDLSLLVLSTDVNIVICERHIKGARGVRIHQAKTDCGESLNRISSDSKSEHDGGLDNSHNANRKLSEIHDRKVLQKAERRPSIKTLDMTTRRCYIRTASLAAQFWSNNIDAHYYQETG